MKQIKKYKVTYVLQKRIMVVQFDNYGATLSYQKFLRDMGIGSTSVEH